MSTRLLDKISEGVSLDAVLAHVPALSALDRLHLFLEILRCMGDEEKIAVIESMDVEDLGLFSSIANIYLASLGDDEISIA